MAILEMQTERKKGTVRGRESRNQTATTKLTEAEYAEVASVSQSQGKSPGEWLRDVALRAARADAEGVADNLLLAEMIGVRLLLVNVLQPFVAERKLTPEAFDKLLTEIGKSKYELAAKLASESGR